jgi:elongation factor Ts
LARAVAEQDQPEPAPETILASKSISDPNKPLSEAMADVYGRLRETMNLVACRRVQAPYLTSYVHHDGKSGVLIGLDAKPTEENVGLDLCHHATFTKPLAIDRDGIPAELIDKVRKQAREIALSEGKPEKIIDKIVEGKANAFCSEKALMEQEHVKVTKTKVRKVLQGAGVNAVTDLVFMKVGA